MDLRAKLAIGGGIVIVVVGLTIGLILSSSHVIDEGNVGIYYRFGKVMDEYSGPGYHTMQPFTTNVFQVRVRSTTDHIPVIEAVTNDGVAVPFYDVQVLNTIYSEKVIPVVKKFGIDFKKALLFDRISEELRKFCAENTIDDVYNARFNDIAPLILNRTRESLERLAPKSIEIINLVIVKPDIPKDLAEKYKQVKIEWTNQLLSSQKQKTDEIKKETQRLNAVADVKREKEILKIELEKEILQKEAEKEKSLIQNEIIKAKETNDADVKAYAKQKQAEANQELYSDKYISLELAKSLSQNTKFYFSGESSPLGALMTKILGQT